MSTVMDRNVIDNIVIGKSIILIISDHLPWNCVFREQHAAIIKNKIDDYFSFIQSGQLNEYCQKSQHRNAADFEKIIIKVYAKYSFSQYCIEFFEKVKKAANDYGYEFEWGHFEDDQVQYHDGFCDDYVFNKEKVYPRIKVNYAKKPDKEIRFMGFMGNTRAATTPDEIPMRRAFEKYVYMIVQDVGDTYKVVEYRDLPDGYSDQQLFEQAFENICKDVQYRIGETTEKGIYMLAAGGNFEAESLLLNGWNEISKNFNDDLIITVPAKDLVFFTPASDKRTVKKLIGMSKNAFENVRRSGNTDRIFTRDVFIYEKNTKMLRIYKKEVL